MDSLATLSPDDRMVLAEAMAALKAPKETLMRHRVEVESLRAVLAAMGRPMSALVEWGDSEDPESLISVSLDLDEHGRAELGDELDRLFDFSLAQALEEVGSLILTRPAALVAVVGEDRTQRCGIGLDHGTWFFADHGKDPARPRWVLEG